MDDARDLRGSAEVLIPLQSTTKIYDNNMYNYAYGEAGISLHYVKVNGKERFSKVFPRFVDVSGRTVDNNRRARRDGLARNNRSLHASVFQQNAKSNQPGTRRSNR